MNSFLQFLISVIYIVPFIVLYAAGIVLSLMNRRKMPKAALFALVGFTLLLINSLLSLLYNAWLHFWYQFKGGTDLSTVIMIESTVVTILGFIASIFLLAAIFVKRDDQTQP